MLLSSPSSAKVVSHGLPPLHHHPLYQVHQIESYNPSIEENQLPSLPIQPPGIVLTHKDQAHQTDTLYSPNTTHYDDQYENYVSTSRLWGL